MTTAATAPYRANLTSARSAGNAAATVPIAISMAHGKTSQDALLPSCAMPAR